MTNLFYDLNYLTIPEFFEDNIEAWMKLFEQYLKIDCTASSMKSIIDLQETIIESIILYSEKYQEEFEKYFKNFSQLIWELSTKLTQDEKYDNLVISTMKFLGSVITKTMYKDIFNGETLNLLLTRIAYPNLTFREIDEENFEDNPIEYIRRDAEGSDSYTRRRSARELIENATKFFENEVFANASQFLSQMIMNYKSNPTQNWKEKDLCINLVIALCARGYSYKLGVLNCSDKINLLNFYQTDIKPELLDNNSHNLPVIKADAMKFCMIFRNQLPKDVITEVMYIVIKFFQTDVIVLHMYSAICIEKFLCIKDYEDPVLLRKPRPRIVREDIQPFINNIVVALFSIAEREEYNYFIL